MNRRAFLRTAGAGAALALTRPPFLSPAAGAEPGDEDWLARARQGIEEQRRGKGLILVRGSDGKPVANARVTIEQLRHDFLFGCNAFMVGRIRETGLEEEYRRRFSALLNYATLGFYWGAYEPQRGQPRYEYTDSVLGWCREQGITVKGHPLAWDHPASSPRWLPEDTEEVERLSIRRVREIVERFRGRIDIWDVVNEPTDLTRFKNPMNSLATSLGALPFTKRHLETARSANPMATLLVNDYRVDPAYRKILEGLRENGKPIFDTIGIQSHMHGGGWPLRKIWEVCDRYADFGAPLHFTETTIVSGRRRGPGEDWHPTDPEGEARQAEYVPRFYTMLFGHPSVEALTWWDFSDLGAWQGAAAGWLRRDMSPKPVYDRLMALIKNEWWTRSEGRTNDRGEFTVGAFFGTHRVTVDSPGGGSATMEVHWQRRQTNRFQIDVE